MLNENNENKRKNMIDKVKKFCSLNAISRYEQPVVDELIKNCLSNESKYTYERDGLGSLIIKPKNINPNYINIQLSAHMDEVGFIVQDFLENGQIRVSMIGGIWLPTIIGTKAYIKTNEGKLIEGVFGHTSIHIMELDKRNKIPELKDIYVDCGFESKEEAIKNGLDIGNCIYLSGDFFIMNKNYLVAKSMDNRAGISVMETVFEQIKNLEIKANVFFVGSVQEEVGTRGARTSVQLVKPQIALAIDTCASHDTYGAISGVQKLGQGVALRIKDGGTLMDPNLINYIFDIANKNNIKAYKYVAQGGGTDACELQYGNGGVATLTLSLAQRYLHSPLGVCHVDDLIATSDLIVEFLKGIDTKTYNEKIKLN